MGSLVVLHALGLSRHSWNPILPRLAERHEVLAIDSPGFGRAPGSEGAPTIARSPTRWRP
ncbi:MAG: hypothetical protein QOG77_2444, partial [Solirubrobacteraceae bacterium]|nr:hypothetical protein [Solirubrobacteraceae bacterium]